MITAPKNYQNESLDNLVKSLDSTAVISESFKNRILSVVEFVGTSGGKQPEVAERQIIDLKEDMDRLLLFSEKFISFVNLRLINGLKLECDKKKGSLNTDQPGTKICKCCGREKSLDQFSFSRVHRITKKGIAKESIYPSPYCKICHNEINKRNKEKRDSKELSEYHKGYWGSYERKPKGTPRKGGITDEEKAKYLESKRITFYWD